MTFSIKDIIAIGAVFSGFGALSTWSIIHSKNISALWNQKQDKNVCEPTHDTIKKDISEIKADVKTLLRRQ